MRSPILASRHLSVLLASAALAACSGSGSSQQAAVANVTPVDPATAGSISVSIGFTGSPPAAAPINMSGVPACAAMHPDPVLDQQVQVRDGKLADVVVYVHSGLGNRAFAPPAQPVVIDQQGCLYHPSVAAVMVGQPLQFHNSDTEGHNVHGHPKIADGWNFLMSRPGQTRDVLFAKPEIGIPVGCDIHPWMRAYVSVFDNPYFGVTGDDGQVVLRNLPPGDYVIGAWHPALGTLVKPVSLTPHGTATLAITYRAPSGS